MKRWVPYGVALAIAFLLQAGLAGWLIADRALLLNNGHEVRLAVVPVDPRDLLRGDYIVLAYDISQLDSAALDGDDSFDFGDAVYVALARADGGTWKAAAMTHGKPATGTWIKGAVSDVRAGGEGCTEACKTYGADYAIERFFVPEGTGRELEKLRNDQHLAVDVALGPDGRAALKRLLVDGAPRYEEPLL
jgi:uncharacterized membrane-anchored protein